MAYGLGTRAPVADGGLTSVPQGLPAGPWRQLSEACRLALVERAMAPGNLFSDGFPAAL